MLVKLSRALSTAAIAALPLTSVSSAALVISADLAFAKGKPDSAGKPAKAGNGNAGTKAGLMKGLNSLKRNINGLMNGSDPKAAGFAAIFWQTRRLENTKSLDYPETPRLCTLPARPISLWMMLPTMCSNFFSSISTTT